MKCFSILTCLFLVGCGYTVKPDHAKPYSETNYLSVETQICEMEAFGINGCYFSSGFDIGAETLKVQGFYKGEIEIFSHLCGIQYVERYELNELKSIPLTQIYKKQKLERKDSCTLSVVLKPDVIEESTEVLYPRLGKVFIEVLPTGVKSLQMPMYDQVMKNHATINYFAVALPENESGEYLFTGCSGEAVRGRIEGVGRIEGFTRKDSCKYQIAFKSDSGKRYLWIFYRNVYARETELLATPVIKRNGEEVCVEGNKSILSFVSINEKWTNSHKACEKFKGTVKVRTFTVRRNNLFYVK